MEIKYDRKGLESFKRSARRKYPLEYLELLFGQVTDDRIEIRQSVPIKHTATLSTDGEPAIEELDPVLLENLKLRLEKEGLAWIGTVHSHPAYAVNRPSEQDNDAALDEGEQVFGIYSFTKDTKTGRCGKSKLCFYLPQRPAPATTA